MRHSSDKGQVEPLAAIAALFAVSAALVVYVGALDDAIPAGPESETPETVHDRVRQNLSIAGAVDPDRLAQSVDTVPEGWQANVTVTAGGRQWHRGPTPQSGGERVTSRVSVELRPGRIEPGQLRVVVWQ